MGWDVIGFELGSDAAKFAAVDCTVERKLCKKEKIKGFPTLKLYALGES